METIQDLERIIEKFIASATEQVSALQQIKLLLNSNALKGFGNPSAMLLSNLNSKVNNSNFNTQLYKDYPLNGRFIDKMEFLDKLHPQGWRLPERRELIILIEGKEQSGKTLDGITGKLQYLRRTGGWIAGKYGNVNKYSFYFKPEWLTEDRKGIKPEFAPPMEVLQGLSEEKRLEKNIVWLAQ
jgi:hypothetical protein